MLPNINAAPFNVKNLLSGNLFLIPDYQRPYSWENDKCSDLWKDLYDHFSDEPEDPYFLGSIILVDPKEESGKKLRVIDGQQRLITLSILLRVFFNKDVRNKGLGRCLYEYDPRDEDKRLGNRIESRVLGGSESKSLAAVLQQDLQEMDALAKNRREKNKYVENYRFFEEQIQDVFKDENTLQKFIDYVLENVYLLPIVSDNLDKALIIFETINTRGLDLSAADIFKSILYQLASKADKTGKEVEDFVLSWNGLTAKLTEETNTKGLTITDLFRWEMSRLRAEWNDEGKLVALRDFFEKGLWRDTSKKLQNRAEYKLDSRPWQDTMGALERLKAAHDLILSTEYPSLRNWYEVLNTYGKDATLPAILCVFQCLEQLPDNSGIWQINTDKEKYCENFFRNIARYVYAKGFDGMTGVKSVYDEMLQAAIQAGQGTNYVPSVSIKESFQKRLDEPLTPKFRRGFCIILELINPKCDTKSVQGEIAKSVQCEIEHILPKRWENDYYDQWKVETVDEALNTLGNLVLLGKAHNIKGSNCFFEKKKEQYGKSCFAEARDLCEYAHWGYDDYKERHGLSKERICAFLCGES